MNKDFRLRLGAGERLLDRLLEDGADISHDCGGTLACASCRVVVREGLEGLEPASEEELDILERAGESAPGARLACQVKGLSSELVVAIPERPAPPPASAARPISITPSAARHLAAQLAKHPGAVAVRLSVERAGCSGFGYRLNPAPAVGEGDTVLDSGGVRIVVDAASLPYVQGTTIDLAQSGLARRLSFDNPNARESCGCGESFSVA
jgi:iron-sulfur cluster assembly protein